jgi:hypothetical protein
VGFRIIASFKAVDIIHAVTSAEFGIAVKDVQIVLLRPIQPTARIPKDFWKKSPWQFKEAVRFVFFSDRIYRRQAVSPGVSGIIQLAQIDSCVCIETPPFSWRLCAENCALSIGYPILPDGRIFSKCMLVLLCFSSSLLER